MFARVIRLEVLRLLRDRRVAGAMAVFAAVFLLSGLTAALEVRHSARIKNAIANEERQRWLNQGEKDPHTAAHYSIYAFKPSLPLQAVDPGITPFVGETVWLEAHLQNDLLFRPQQDAQVFERMGLVDPAALLTRFGPLAVFLLAFAAAAREREDGVMGLALGIAPRRALYLGGKAASVLAVSACALVLPAVLSGAISVAVSSVSTRDEVVRLASWTIAAALYVAALSTLAVAICATARSVQTAFAALLLVWVGLVLAALPAASAVAKWRRPLPSFQAMKLVVAREAAEYWTPEYGDEQMAGILRRSGVSQVSDLTINDRGALLDAMERHAHEVFDREIGGFYDRVAAQDASYASLGALSPAVAFQVTSAALSGTDFKHHRHFIEFTEQYRRALVNRMNGDLIPNPTINGKLHTNDARLWSQVPAFEYRAIPALLALRSVTLPLFGLMGWLAGGAAAVAVAARYVRP
jgi:ABC-2 type transport system permease protein